jgi:hypothetical protein
MMRDINIFSHDCWRSNTPSRGKNLGFSLNRINKRINPSSIVLVWILISIPSAIASNDLVDGNVTGSSFLETLRGTQAATEDFCELVGDNVWETVTAPSSQKVTYLLKGAKLGSCASQCNVLCNHQDCYDDFALSGRRCICKTNKTPVCGANTKCVSDKCECLPGFAGNAVTGCTAGNQKFLYQRKYTCCLTRRIDFSHTTSQGHS